jgi:putative ABC transport system permease protein
VRAALAEYDTKLPTTGFYKLERLVDDAVGPRKFITRLLGFFSGLALALAATGLYGVIAYSVTQRTQEIGIRMAVGAQRSDVLGLIAKGGLGLVAIGGVVGLAGSFALSRLLQSMLYGVSSHDPLVYIADTALLFVAAGAACVIPAIRATRVDPMVALRNE